MSGRCLCCYIRLPTFLIWNNLCDLVYQTPAKSYQCHIPVAFGIPDRVSDMTYQTPTRHALLGSGRPPKTKLKANDTPRFLLWTFVAQLVATTKICSQPRQNAAATKRATNMVSSDTDDGGILIAGVLLSGAFLNECKKKLISLNKAFGLIDGENVKNTEHITASLQSEKQTNNNWPISAQRFRNLLHRLEQVAIQIWVEQLVAQLSNRHDRRATKVPSCATKVRNKSLHVFRVKVTQLSWADRRPARTLTLSAAASNSSAILVRFGARSV